MRARREKSAAQQCKYYEVENIFEYMFSVYIKGNITPFRELYQELSGDAKREFISYCFSEINPQYTEEIIIATISIESSGRFKAPHNTSKL